MDHSRVVWNLTEVPRLLGMLVDELSKYELVRERGIPDGSRAEVTTWLIKRKVEDGKDTK